VFSDVQVHAEAAGGKAAEIMVRPQALRLAQPGEPSLAATVRDVTFLGDTTSLLLETRWGQQFWMRSNVRQLATTAVGETLNVTWQVADCHLFGQ
jgi:putative spermidine/putrescine transport system ATP-binding protein